MRYGIAVLTLALGLALPLPALAQNTGSTAAMSPAQAEAHRAAGDALAAAIVPNAMIEPQSDRLVEALLDQLFKQDESLKKLETAFPGMRDALGAGLKPIIVRQAHAIMPRYRGDLSRLYQANLTTAEARRAAEFIASPAFVAFTSAAYANMDYKTIAGALSEERDVTAAEVRSDIYAAGAKTGAALSTKELATISVFMSSLLGAKLRALNPQKLAIETKWTNYTEPAAELEVAAAVEQAMIAHIALSDPEFADELRKDLAKPQN
jgi:hypothetical protein